MRRSAPSVIGGLERYASMREQSDIEFASACGLAYDSEAGQTAIRIRKELAEYGRGVNPGIKTDSICASTKIIDTGILHPADSIDLIEYTLHMESMIGGGFDDNDARLLAAAGSENMEVRDWITLALEIRARKLEANNLPLPTGTSPVISPQPPCLRPAAGLDVRPK